MWCLDIKTGERCFCSVLEVGVEVMMFWWGFWLPLHACMAGCITGWVFDIFANAFIEYHDVIHDSSRLVLKSVGLKLGRV